LAEDIKNHANANQTRLAVPVHEIRGIAKPDNDESPTDAEINEDYAVYLSEKYS